MHVDHSPDGIKATLENLAHEAAQLMILNYELKAEIEAALERLPSQPPNGLDLHRYTARQITDALMALGDRRTALVRTWTNAELEQQRGRRSGGIGGAPRIPNGEGGHRRQLEMDI